MYIYTYTHMTARIWRCTGGSHDFDSHNFNLRVSNPGAIPYFRFKVPLESSNLPGAGPICPD